MDLAGLLVFGTALFLAAASPGPGVVAIVARVLGRGMNGALAVTADVAVETGSQRDAHNPAHFLR